VFSWLSEFGFQVQYRQTADKVTMAALPADNDLFLDEENWPLMYAMHNHYGSVRSLIRLAINHLITPKTYSEERWQVIKAAYGEEGFQFSCEFVFSKCFNWCRPMERPYQRVG